MGIAVLGPLSIDGRETLGRRDRTVLAALTLHPGEEVRTERLYEVLWGETPPASAAKVVQGCVVRLRKQLGPGAIGTTVGGYRLALQGDEVDAWRFRQALTRGSELLELGATDRASAVLAEALAWWRGDALPELEEWEPGRVEALHLAQLRLRAEELYVESELRRGAHDRVLEQAMSMVDEAPLREHRWLLLARAHYQAGRQSDALDTIRRLREVLAEELGLDAGAEADALEEAILRQDPVLTVAADVEEPDASCPYPGMLPYGIDDSATFFGRDSDVAACLRRLRDGSVVAVVGPSGSGKSSVVRAGIAAALLRDGRTVAVFSPGDHPMAALAAATGPSSKVLVVDQCEEAFSLCRDVEERTAFLTALARWVGGGQLVLSIRSDHVDDLATHPDLARVVERGLYLIGEMTETQLREAIEGPAQRAGLRVEPGLVDLLVNEVERQPGALPMLSHTLSETWRRREGRTLTLAAYQASGGVRGAVAMTAEAVYGAGDPDQRAALRDVMLRLVTVGEDKVPLRTRLPRRAVVDDPSHADVLDQLVAARLVTSDGETVELAHEALARAWPRLRGWLDEDVDGQRIRQHLTVAAEAWHASGRPGSELYRGARLAAALGWRRTAEQRLPEVEADFLDAGERLADAERLAAEDRARRQARANNLLRGMLAAAAVLLVAALVAGVLAVRQASSADHARRSAVRASRQAAQAATTADSRRLGARALTTDDIGLSLLLAIEGVRLEDTPESRANLAAVIARRPGLARAKVVPGATMGNMASVGRAWHLVVSDGTGGVRFLDRALVPLGTVTIGPSSPPAQQVVAASPPGGDVAVGLTSPSRRPVILVDGVRQQLSPVRLGGFPSSPSRAVAVDLSKDRRHLVALLATAASMTAYVWDLRTPAHPHHFRVPEAPQGVAISPDGRTVFTTWPATAYDARTGAVRWRSTLRGQGHVDVDGSGRLLALPLWDQRANDRVVLLDAATGRLRERLIGHRGETHDVLFSPDGRLLATVGDDQTVFVWDVATGQARTHLDTGQVTGISISPDSTHVATMTPDSGLQVWDLSGAEGWVAREATGPALSTTDSGSVATSPDGLTVAVARSGPGDVARLTFVHVIPDDSTQAGPLPGPAGRAVGAWSADGSSYAVGTLGRVSSWNAVTARRTHLTRVGETTVTGLDFLASGSLLVADASGRVQLLGADLAPRGNPVDLGADTCCLTAGPRPGTAVVFSDPSRAPAGPVRRPHTQWNLVDVRSGRVLASHHTDLDATAAALSPDRSTVAATGTGGGLWLFDARTGRVRVRPATREAADGYAVTWEPEGHLIATTDDGGGTVLSDGRTGAATNSVAIADQAPSVATFLYGGQDLTLTSVRGGVYDWTYDQDSSLRLACELAGRNLTRAEWKAFVGSRPYARTCHGQYITVAGERAGVDPGGAGGGY